jgi:hypothetical protein
VAVYSPEAVVTIYQITRLNILGDPNLIFMIVH